MTRQAHHRKGSCMPSFDLPLEELRRYSPAHNEPADFDEFWQSTIQGAASHDLEPVFALCKTDFSFVDVYDVAFSGFNGQRILAWLLVPHELAAPATAIVKYRGYGDGRGYPHEWLLWPAAGFPVLVMDTRGQPGCVTPDLDATGDPQWPGFVTRGIADRSTYYYRRLFMDAYRAVDVAACHPAVDPTRIIVMGSSQGGAVAQAVAGLRPDLFGALVDVPFLTHVSRAVDLADGSPYEEIVQYLSRRQDMIEQVFNTLGYFDGLSFAVRATAPARYSVGLLDKLCPPSTVFAAYNRYGGVADIDVWQFNGHEGGGTRQQLVQLRWIRELSHRAAL